MTQNTNLKTTVAMIVRDEEAVIASTIESAQLFADEIIVLDTGSADRTREIAKDCGAVVLSANWADDFAAARNQCLSHAGGEWVMWLDAGEYLPAAEATSLRTFIENDADPSCAYAMLVQTPVQNKEISGEQIAVVRLVPNRQGICFEGRIRESMNASFEKLGIQIEGAPQRIQRSDRDHQPERRQQRATRNVHLADLQIQAAGPTPAMLNCLAESFQHLGDIANSTRFYQRSLREAAAGSTDQLEAYYGMLTVLDETPDSRDDQLALCLKAVEHFPLDIQLLCAMGGYLHTQGRAELALRAYRLAHEHGQLNPQIWHMQDVYEIAATCFVAMLQLQGQSEEAGDVMEAVVAKFPQYAPLRRQLIEWYTSNGKRDEAIELLDLHASNEPGAAAMRSAIRGACLSKQGDHVAAVPHLRSAFDAGCRESICLQNLVASLSATGDLAGTLVVLDEWLQFEPENQEVARLRQTLADQAAQSATGRTTRVDAPGAASPTSKTVAEREDNKIN